MSTTNENTLWEEKNSIEPKKNCLNNNATELNDIINDTSNVSTKNPCNDTGKISGIYKIVNKVNGKYYVGSSRDIYGEPHGRFYQHKAHLKCQRHYNSHLQSAWNNYKPESFEFVVVEKTTCEKNMILEIEQKYLNVAKTEKHVCYNKSFTACGPDWTEENKRKRSILISGKNNPNYGNGDKIRGVKNPFFGKKHTEETKRKMALHHANYPRVGRCDKNIYTFFNILTSETFSGLRFDFIKKYNLSQSCVCLLVKHPNKVHKGWIIRSHEL